MSKNVAQRVAEGMTRGTSAARMAAAVTPSSGVPPTGVTASTVAAAISRR
jgi:hypothetical protein